MFDGQFKSKPTQALRGSSQRHAAALDIISSNRARRQERSNARREWDAALVIQRIVRGSITRGYVKSQCRQQFDLIIGNGDGIYCTKLLVHFFDPSCDHDRLVRLLRLKVDELKCSRFTVTLMLSVCIRDSHHQVFSRGCREAFSLVFVDNLSNNKLFNLHWILDYLNLSRLQIPFLQIIQLIDRQYSVDSLVKLSRVIATKFSHLILHDLVLNDEFEDSTRIIDLLIPPDVSPEQCHCVLDNLDLDAIAPKLGHNFNFYLDKVVYYLCKMMADVATANKALHALLRILQSYTVPQLAHTSSDISDSSSDDGEGDDGDMAMVTPTRTIYYNFQCIDRIFQKYEVFPFDRKMSYVAYIMITKYNLSVIKTPALRRLCFRAEFIKWLWGSLGGEELEALVLNKTLTNTKYQEVIPLLTLFSGLFTEYIRSSHDADILDNFIFTHPELIRLCNTFRDLSLTLSYLDVVSIRDRVRSVPGGVATLESELVLATEDWVACWRAATTLTCELYRRDTRLKITEEPWNKTTLSNITRDNIRVFIDPESVSSVSVATVKDMSLLNNVPFIIPFTRRVEIFHHILSEDYPQDGSQFHGSGAVRASIRRDYIYEDAYAQLNKKIVPDLKKRVQIQLVNFTGLDEAGVDGGGLFREFITTFLKEAFNPNRGFFVETDGLLHPNPAAPYLYPDYKQHYYFIGSLLAKAIYEKLLVDISLAAYILDKLLGRVADVNHLRSLDLNMYRNILSLRTFTPETISDMCLYFVVDDNVLGETKSIELKQGGSQTQVTKDNLIEYIHLVSDYRLNRQIKSQFRYFADGFYSVISPGWLSMFSYTEFQCLLSGTATDIDISDLKNNTEYHGVYNTEHATILLFWEAVEDMCSDDQRKLLSFVTSSDRTPLLGFQSLVPRFGIHSAGVEDRLPTASTCMNLLKLPEFTDIDIMRRRLYYVLNSGAGFELS